MESEDEPMDEHELRRFIRLNFISDDIGIMRLVNAARKRLKELEEDALVGDN